MLLVTIIVVVVAVVLIAFLIKAISTRQRLHKRALYLKRKYPHAFLSEMGSVDFIFKEYGNKKLRILLEDYSTEPQLERLEKQILERLEKEEQERKEKQRQFERIKAFYPAGYATFEKCHHSPSVELILQSEEQIKQYEEYSRIITDRQLWHSSQDTFSAAVGDQHNALIAGWGSDTIPVNLPSINEFGGKEAFTFDIPCHFFYKYCRDKSLDYSADSLAGSYSTDIDRLESLRSHFKDRIYDQLLPFISSIPGPVTVVFSDSGQGTRARRFNSFHYQYFVGKLDNSNIPHVEIEELSSLIGRDNKNLILIDVTSTIDDIKENCRYILNFLQTKHPCITHISVLREISKEQMNVILEQKRAEAAERTRRLQEYEARRQQEEQERLERERREAEQARIQHERDRLAALSLTKKDESGAIQNYLQSNYVRYFYHFTDRRNLDSIREHGGLLSWEYCVEHDIPIPYAGGGDTSRTLDRRHGLSDYVRLSFCNDHPMAFRLKQSGYDLVLLKIKVDVASIDTTLFSNMNATDNNHHHGGNLSDLRQIDIAATRAEYLRSDDPQFKPHQAEVLVKTFVPLKYIINIDDPEDMR